MPDCLNCTIELCVVRNRKLPRSMFAQCSGGHSESVDTLLDAIETARETRRAERNANPLPSKSPRIVPPPDVSDFGTRLQSAIQAAGTFTYQCGQCKQFLRSLNQTTHHDTEKILDGLMLHGELPIHIRDKVGGTKEQRVWLRAIVERVINDKS